jgi:hypothetical protein
LKTRQNLDDSISSRDFDARIPFGLPVQMFHIWLPSSSPLRGNTIDWVCCAAGALRSSSALLLKTATKTNELKRKINSGNLRAQHGLLWMRPGE